MMAFEAVAIGGSIGAPARFIFDKVIGRRAKGAFPWGTIAVNLSGSITLGVLTGLALPQVPTALLSTGFCGAYTTFSTFEFETIRLWQEGMTFKAAANVIISVVAGLGLALIGLWLGATLSSR